jgi:hypothetical protein
MRATNEESYSDNDRTVANDASNDEDAYRIHLSERISDEFEHLINEERACRAKGRDDPVIDSGTTGSCSSEVELFRQSHLSLGLDCSSGL